MAAISPNNYPCYLGTLSPYIENKKIRTSIYALSILTIGAAAFCYGNTKIGFTLGAAGCFVQGYEIVQIAQEIKNNPGMDQETKNKKISRITNCVFTMTLIWGVVMSGLNLSLLCHEGTLILRNAHPQAIRSFLEEGLKKPHNVVFAWLKAAPSLIYHANHLASLVGFAIPHAYNVIYWADDLFFGKQQLSNEVYQLCEKALNIWLAVREEVTLISLFLMIKDMVQAINIWSYLSKTMDEVSPQMIAIGTAIQNFLPRLLRLSELRLKDIYELVTTFSNPPVSRAFIAAQQKNSSAWKKTKYVVNHVFFHTLNLSLMAARLYYHRFSTATPLA